MPIRKEVMGEIQDHLKEHKFLPVSRRDRIEANKRLEAARLSYEDARRESLRHELTMFYRVAIFGSARLDRDSEEFKFVTDLSKALVEARPVDIVTGGGPGIMEAANYGVHLAMEEAGGYRGHGRHRRTSRKFRPRTHGLTIADLPTEEGPNSFIHFESKHPEFATRLQEFMDKTQAAYHAQGGIGTLLEQLIVVQSRQVDHLEDNYLILAHPFWEPMVEAWNNSMYHNRDRDGLTPLISESHLNLIRFTDKVPEVVDAISANYDRWRVQIRNHVRITT